ncbi:MAG: 3'-5' exonuclease [Leptospira sp.]|nr:3'-5' exonuclease [Leptospira sp.]
MKTLFLDLEATGTDPENDRIIEIGIVNYDPEEVLDISLLVNPLTDLSQEIINLTGISNDELKRKLEIINNFLSKELKVA